MKKIFLTMLLCLVAVTLCAAPITVSAEEADPVIDATEPADITEATEPADVPEATEPADVPEATEPTETPDNDPTPETSVTVTEATAPTAKPEDSSAPSNSNDDGGEAHTLFTRIWEFFKTYPEETVSIAGSAVLVILNIILKMSAKKTKTAIDGIAGSVSNTLSSQNNVVGAINDMIGGYNTLSANYGEMKQAYDQYGAMEGERNRVNGAILVTNTAILEILTTVYANSKNLPQGVKDIVNLKYANCLKALDDDEQLVAIVEAVRSNIGSAADITESSEETETDSEV